jgi:hypothetical protein
MFRKYNKQLTRSTCSIIGTLLLCSVANASTIHVKNGETVDVSIIIEGGSGTVLPSKKEIKDVLKAGEEKTYKVTKETFGSEEFTVTGKVAIPSMNNKCELLSIDKDYNITFTGTKTGGTVCNATVTYE